MSFNATDYGLTQLRIEDIALDLQRTKETYNECLDTIWMLLASLLVFFMHAGFSMLESGCVRFKNTQNILAKNLIVVCLGFLCWYIIGYPIALGVTEDPGKFMGGTDFAMANFWEDKSKFRVWFFQGAFCATGGTIVSGAMAERTQLKGFAIFTFLMTSIIYPAVVYWGWSGSGLLWYTDAVHGDTTVVGGPPIIDFAGSGIVHLVGGVGALVGIVVCGPRHERWEKPDDFTAHSIPFCVLGTFFLWFGWYGFNPGSTGSMHDKDTAFRAGLVACNTTLAPCVAGLIVFLLRATLVYPFCLDVGGFCNGILAGLVAITAGCSVVKPWEALIIGAIGGLLYQGVSMLLRVLKLDDVVDAVPVHGACGLWGLLAVGFFGNPEDGMGGNGVFHGGNQLGVQCFAAFLIILWVSALSAMVFVPLRALGWLRLSDYIQETGADIVEHSPPKDYKNAEPPKQEDLAKPVDL